MAQTGKVAIAITAATRTTTGAIRTAKTARVIEATEGMKIGVEKVRAVISSTVL